MPIRLFVIICTVLIIVGFIASCYLMTTVNPDPIVTTDKLIAREREFVFDFDNMPDKDGLRDVQYGLEKAPTSSETPVPLPYLFRKNNPSLLSTQENSNQKTVYPPNQVSLHSHVNPSRTTPMMASNTTLPYNCKHVSKQSEETRSPKNNTGNSTDHAKISQPVKGRRRSIDSLQKRFDDISGSVLLKIVDDQGKARIEIKLNTNEDTQTFRNKNSSIDNNFVSMTDDMPQDLLISLDELPDRTEIRILPNSTLVVSDVSEEFGSQIDMNTETSYSKSQRSLQNAVGKHTSKYDVVKGQNGTIAVISRPGSNGLTEAMTVGLSNTNHDIQRTTHSAKQLLKTISTGDLALKILFDNVTRSFNRETYSINKYTNNNRNVDYIFTAAASSN